MVVRSAGDQTEALLHQFLSQNCGVFHDLLSIGLELGLQRFAEAHGLGGDDVLQRAALRAGKHGGVDLLIDLLVVAEDQAAPGPPEGLVGGGGHHIGVGDGGGMDSGGYQTGDVCHVHHQIGTYLVRHLAELGKVNDAGIGAGTGNDDLGTAFLGGLE